MSANTDLERGSIDLTHDLSIRSTAIADNDPPRFSKRTTPIEPYGNRYGSSAPIWAKYLKETEATDKERAEAWKTSLDSLLVFAGLFAGVVSSFLVDGRSDLQSNSNQVLLSEILLALRNESAASPLDPFVPNTQSLVINGFWYASLSCTLIGALAAVLAKTWVNKFIPVSPGERRADACDRHLRSQGADEWHMDAFIAAIPLLIQLSLAFFFAGLVMLSITDDHRIGAIISILAGVSFLIYILLTMLPAFFANCPFETTVTALIPWTSIKRRYNESHRDAHESQSNSDEKKGIGYLFWKNLYSTQPIFERFYQKSSQRTMESHILAWTITSSIQSESVEESIRALASADFDEKQAWDFVRNGGLMPVVERFLQAKDSSFRTEGVTNTGIMLNSKKLREALNISPSNVIMWLKDKNLDVREEAAAIMGNMLERGR